jgi:hypothetical protein
MKFRAAVATAATLPLALGLAACGNDQPDATGHKPSAPVESTTAAPQKAAPGAHLNRVTFAPAMNAALTKQKSWRVSGTMTSGGSTVLTIDGIQTVEPVAMSVAMTGAPFDGKTAKVVLIGSTGYASIPGETPAGKYMKFEAGDSAELDELLEGGDPTKIFKSFDGALKSVKFVGTEAVRRQKLDKYEITVDTAKALAAQGKTVPAGVPGTLTYWLWLDKADLVRKLEFNLAGIGMEMSLSDYNKPARISAPPASKIVS